MRASATLLCLLSISLLITISTCIALPSEYFNKRDNEIFDSWGLCRTRAYGKDGFFQITEEGFRPAIVFESLSENRDLAWKLGKELAKRYRDRHELAEAIFYFVRDRVRYMPDIEQFGVREFAQNADEVARTIVNEEVAYGDCEDYAVILAVMYKAAGFRSAIVLAPGHAAVLVYLPNYDRANVKWTLEGERGWVWAEATGRNNRFGYTPSRYIGETLLAYEIKEEPLEVGKPPKEVKEISVERGGFTYFSYSPFFSIIFFMWLIRMIGAMFGRR